MKFPLKGLILAVALGAATAAHAGGIPIDGDFFDFRKMLDQKKVQAQDRAVAPTQTSPANLGAWPSAYADAGKVAATPSDGYTLGIASDNVLVSCDPQGYAHAFGSRNGWSISEPYFGTNTDGRPMKCLALSHEAVGERIRAGTVHFAPITPDRPRSSGETCCIPVVDVGALSAQLIQIDTTLKQLLELERAKATAASH